MANISYHQTNKQTRVTSTFNNLGIKFYAPSDFISYWCDETDGNDDFSTSKLNFLNNSTISLSTGTLYQSYILNKQITTGYQTPNVSLLRRECYTKSGTKCTKFRFDTGIWSSTIIDEWSLVCDQTWLVSFAQSLYMSGFVLAFAVFGLLSDRYGRWKTLFSGACIEVASGLGCASAKSMHVFLMFRFLMGLGCAARSSTAYMVMIECVGPRWRMTVSTLGTLGWIVGYCTMPWFQLYFVHFRRTQMFVCFYEFIFILLMYWLPESPRWLLTQRKFDQAYHALFKMAKFNGLIIEDDDCNSNSNNNNNQNSWHGLNVFDKQASKSHHTTDAWPLTNLKDINVHPKDLSNNKNSSNSKSGSVGFVNEPKQTDPNILAPIEVDYVNCFRMFKQHFEPYTRNQFDIKFATLVDHMNKKEYKPNENRLSLIDLFKMKNLRKYSIILYISWMSNSFIYYGLALGVGEFGGGKNLFVDFTIAGLIEIPSCVFTIFFMKTMPRRATSIFIYSTTGTLCALLYLFRQFHISAPQLALAMLAKLFITCAFNVLLYQTIELYPTSLRQTAYSSCSLAGRLGSISAPFSKDLGRLTNEQVPFILNILLVWNSAFMAFWLPETKGIDMPDTLLEAEKIKKRKQSLTSATG